jgi:DNA-binding MarR family transcriptional regulator
MGSGMRRARRSLGKVRIPAANPWILSNRESPRVLKSCVTREGLGHEIGKKNPFDSLPQEAYLNLMRTSSVLGADFARLFREHGLSDATFNTLRILRGASDTGITCGEIGTMLVTRVPDVTRLVDRLVEDGLATRQRGRDDKRTVRVKISSLGLKKLKDLDGPLLILHEAQLGHMKAEDLRALVGLLELARATPRDPEGGLNARNGL